MSIKRQALFLDIILCCSWHKFLEARRLVTAWWWNTRSDLAPAARAAAILLWRLVRSRIVQLRRVRLRRYCFMKVLTAKSRLFVNRRCRIALVCAFSKNKCVFTADFNKQARFCSQHYFSSKKLELPMVWRPDGGTASGDDGTASGDGGTASDDAAGLQLCSRRAAR